MNAHDKATLHHAIQTTPIIDNHAHPLLKQTHVSKQALLSIASEAQGEALTASKSSLPHLRAVNHLASKLGCEASWEAVEAAIDEKRGRGYRDWIGVCLAGIACVLVDDGLDGGGDVEPYSFFDGFTAASARRIVRIEAVAAGLIEDACLKHDSADKARLFFTKQLDRVIEEALDDDAVVAFKSVICYRTGLAISPSATDCDPETFTLIFTQRRQANSGTFTRVNHVQINDYLVHRLAHLVSLHNPPKPIQFHTGLGDNDLTLTTASPSHLQPFIRLYPSVPMVLLHSGYPFVCEAGYLAAMYANVYADIGEVFPFLGRDAQEGVLRQMLGLCPASKILWSTDGHWFPETYFLAVMQMREVFEGVLGDVLFNNSNQLYGLHLEMNKTSVSETPLTLNTDLDSFLQLGSSLRFLRVCWLDMTSTARLRSIPTAQVMTQLRSDSRLTVGMTQAALGMTQNDGIVPGVSVVGEWHLRADFSSLRLGPRHGQATVMGDFIDHDGSEVVFCPRTLLRKAVATFQSRHVSFSLGFEIELVLLNKVGDGLEICSDGGHAWATARPMDGEAAVTVIEEAVERLALAGVSVEMIHAESAPGQYEVVLPRAPPLQAVDTLLLARSIISCCADAAGYRATLHPKPIPDGCGSASHVHLSMTSQAYESFYAGVLTHLRAICAFTLSSPVSYDRVRQGTFAGGTWVAWGTQNRETALRKIKGSHWEVKCMDGLANPYLAISAILFAGWLGLEGGYELSWGDCTREPHLLSRSEREALGI
ncbi:developmental protein FluG [Ophiocordyceps camponoti-floridani]|uniref:Glutamine synthetase n=1 Tax=Ophiocordyceps camponoti-floridani TaxID=2030778 RepID=A0A8H4Q2E8_9HYPO|nr:developmental protein FluG [Ophiocordyceps camponoti-floridani]